MYFYFVVAFSLLLQIEARVIIEADAAQVCVKELHIDIRKLAEVEFTGPTITEDNPSFNILAGCLWEKVGIWTKDYQINEAQLIHHIQGVAVGALGGDPKDYVDDAKEIAIACKGLKANTYGETSTKIQNCIITKIAKMKSS